MVLQKDILTSGRKLGQTRDGFGNVAGVFSAFSRRATSAWMCRAGLPTYLKLSCAPRLVDEQTLLVKVGAISRAPPS